GRRHFYHRGSSYETGAVMAWWQFWAKQKAAAPQPGMNVVAHPIEINALPRSKASAQRHAARLMRLLAAKERGDAFTADMAAEIRRRQAGCMLAGHEAPQTAE